ncbi:MAG TPA: DinB family protein, partial [Acidimicrobiales bacterium]|nr:DinB family protein [Acidimicrobiales bacterium]
MADDNPALLRHFQSEQEEFVALCKTLTDEQWAHASLCPEWAVRQTMVHVAWHIHRNIGDTLRFLLYGTTQGPARQIARDETRSTADLIEWLASPGHCALVNLGEL